MLDEWHPNGLIRSAHILKKRQDKSSDSRLRRKLKIKIVRTGAGDEI